jgi:hypothetical protein
MHSDSDGAPRPQRPAPEHAAPGPPDSGDGRVDEALARLADLDGRPIDEHPAVFEAAVEELTAALGTLDSGAQDISGTSGTRGTSPPSITPGS